MATHYSNEYNLPGPVSEAIKFFDEVASGNLPVSRLGDAPQISYLRKRNDVEEDVSDKVWSMINRALIQVIENGNPRARVLRALSVVSSHLHDVQSELRLSEDSSQASEYGLLASKLDELVLGSLPDDGWLIRQSMSVEVPYSVDMSKGFTHSGTTRVYDTIAMYEKASGTLYFPRVCSTAMYTKPQLRTGWIREANTQATILEFNGFEVKRIVCVMVYKDWHSSRAIKSDSYPLKQIDTVDFELKDFDTREKFIRQRVAAHAMTEMGDIVECKPADQWKRADEYAVVRPGAKRPVIKKFLNRTDAEEHLQRNRHMMTDAFVDIIPGERTRCEHYCSVREFCKQWEKERESTRTIQQLADDEMKRKGIK
jgi:hypothetical protein